VSVIPCRGTAQVPAITENHGTGTDRPDVRKRSIRKTTVPAGQSLFDARLVSLWGATSRWSFPEDMHPFALVSGWERRLRDGTSGGEKDKRQMVFRRFRCQPHRL